MISIIFPPGAYGSFLSSCLYMFTELAGPAIKFEFGAAGNSHSIKSNKDYQSKIQVTHIPYQDEFDRNNMSPDKTVIILPDRNHMLDYFDNQFYKHQAGDLVKYIQTMFPNSVLNGKLEQFGTRLECFDNWQMREYISFWINNCLLAGYSTDLYTDPDGYRISSLDLFNIDFAQEFSRMATYVGCHATNTQDLAEHHKKFVSLQEFHNMQLKCEQWTNDVLAGKNCESPCITIFDEAYVQYLLRKLGVEIKCYQLNKFPRNSKDLHSLLQLTN
jgi:hypothetical protein